MSVAWCFEWHLTFSFLITVAIDVDGAVSAAADQGAIPRAGTDPLGSVPKGTPFGGKYTATAQQSSS